MTLSLIHITNYRASIAELPTPHAEAKLIALWLDGLYLAPHGIH